MSERVFVEIGPLKVKLQFQNVEVGTYAVPDHGQDCIAKQFLSDSFEALRDLLRRGQCRKVEQRCKARIVIPSTVAKIGMLVLGVAVTLCKSRSFPSVIGCKSENCLVSTQQISLRINNITFTFGNCVQRIAILELSLATVHLVEGSTRVLCRNAAQISVNEFMAAVMAPSLGLSCGAAYSTTVVTEDSDRS